MVAERGHPAAGFDHEEGAVLAGREGPGTVPGGHCHFPLVGDQHLWQAGFALVADSVSIAIIEDEPAGGRDLPGEKREDEQGEKGN